MSGWIDWCVVMWRRVSRCCCRCFVLVCFIVCVFVVSALCVF